LVTRNFGNVVINLILKKNKWIINETNNSRLARTLKQSSRWWWESKVASKSLKFYNYSRRKNIIIGIRQMRIWKCFTRKSSLSIKIIFFYLKNIIFSIK